jgi:tetratricopeptide (TPR) repeat protein
LTLHQQQKLAQLEAEWNKARISGQFSQALARAKQSAELRQRWQGFRHWQTINAQFEVQRLQRLALLDLADQREVGKAVKLREQQDRHYRAAKFSEAEQSSRKSFKIIKKVLGDQHPETAEEYNSIGYCLQAQGKAVQALPYFEKALAIRKSGLGPEHRETAISYINVAFSLQAQGKLNQALPLFEKALAICRKVLGEEHPETALAYNNLGSCLQSAGKPGQGQRHFEKGLAISKKIRGEMHPDTARGYNNAGANLLAQGMAAQALTYYLKSLQIGQKIWGENHPHRAVGYSNLAVCLSSLGKEAHALPFLEKALAIQRKLLGDNHPATAITYCNLASCLRAQGKDAHALPLYEKALAINKNTLGEGHPETARVYNYLGCCFQAKGMEEQALRLYEKALSIRKEALGEEHPETAESCQNVGYCLDRLGKHSQALPFFEKSLAIRKNAFGEGHPETAIALYDLAWCLSLQGKPSQALPSVKKAVAINKKMQGEGHRDTSEGYSQLALCQYTLGNYLEARRAWTAALLGYDAGRVGRAITGFERAQGNVDRLTPRNGLALLCARSKQPRQAWKFAEADLARNLLEDTTAPKGDDKGLSNQLQSLDQRMLKVLSKVNRTDEDRKLLLEMDRQRRSIQEALNKQIADRSAKLVWSLEQVQKQLLPDSAAIFWLAVLGENWACIVRSSGSPQWVQLSGTGPKGQWTAENYGQFQRLHKNFTDPQSSDSNRKDQIAAIRKRWFDPLRPHLQASERLPAVRRLFVVPTKITGAVPLEPLLPDYEVSYTPSATVLAQARSKHRALKNDRSLVLGDPIFQATPPEVPPMSGLLVVQVLSDGSAAKAGLREGDLLLRFGNNNLKHLDDLVNALKESPRGEAVYWRQGKKYRVTLAQPLGVRLDRRDGATALREWRRNNKPVSRNDVYQRLPGTRAEVNVLQRLLGKNCKTLLGAEASQQMLEAMAVTGELKKFRLVHLATHGTLDMDRPERSAIILARDHLPAMAENAERVRQGKKPITGELTVQTILDDWNLDADLVVLSACQTGLGKPTSGDGLLGFSYALMKAGARSVVLSRWKVDDAATALLMVRFYENLLGKKPLGKAAALSEAKKWLRTLPRKEAMQLQGALLQGKLAGTRGSVVPLKINPDKVTVPTGDKPYEHPFYWAAFILVGDPD